MSSLACFTVEEGRGVGPGPDMSQGGELGGGSNEELLLSVAKPVERARDRFIAATCLLCWSVRATSAVSSACFWSVARDLEVSLRKGVAAKPHLLAAQVQ